MGNVTKSDRLDLRLTKQHKQEIEQAAALSGRSVTDFSVSVLVKEAAEVIRRERDLAMSLEAWEAFNRVLDRPARPVEMLASLLKRPTVFDD
ncbi:type II toxin-antitoxin system antitoxin AtaR [Leifsonia kafniensis]|uniref:Type II toxin-antitoxin system antitoxin AtaR n=1 Tax=Leifsonia kafniensis TaxID=475957 RepID=A0ABP7L3V7_9MICO